MSATRFVEHGWVERTELGLFFEKEGGIPPILVDAMFRTPVGSTVLKAWREAMFGGQLPHRLKEIVRLAVSRTPTDCSSRGRMEGITDEMIRELGDFEASQVFEPSEKIALRYATRFENDEVDSDEIFAELRLAFSDEEIIELGKVCALVVGFDQLVEWISSGSAPLHG